MASVGERDSASAMPSRKIEWNAQWRRGGNSLSPLRLTPTKGITEIEAVIFHGQMLHD
jgi:hypothetical protein